MSDLLTNLLRGRPGLPQAPATTPSQEALHQEMIQREQAKLPAWKKALGGVLTAPAEALSGAFYDPTQPLTPEQRNPAFGAGAMAAALPFAPKGIKGMYSRVEKIAESLPKEIHPNKLGSILRNRTSQEEVQWRGIDKLMQGAGNTPIQKQQVVETLEKNPLDVKVIEKGPGKDRWVNDENGVPFPENEGVGTTYDNYQMPGASNYRETIIQLAGRKPEQQLSDAFAGTKHADPEVTFKSQHWDEPNPLVHVRHNERDLPPKPSYSLRMVRDTNGPEQFHAGHIYKNDPVWNRKDNIVASVWPRRSIGQAGAVPEVKGDALDLIDQMMKQGPQSSHGRILENVQSDWHQRGAHQGYTTSSGAPPGMAEDVAMFDARMNLGRINDEILAEMGNIPKADRLAVSDEWDIEETSHNLDAWLRYWSQYHPQFEPFLGRIQQARVAYDQANDAAQRSAGAVPDAPFKDNWAELALKQQLLDVADRPDLDWIGIAPSSELRQRGEVISPEFQDQQLPRTLEKLLAPFGGGKMEQADLGVKSEFAATPMWDGGIGHYGGFVSTDPNYVGGPDRAILSLLPTPANVADWDGGIDATRRLLEDQVPNIQALITRLSPEMKAAIREKGFPLLTLLYMLQANEELQKQGIGGAPQQQLQ